MADIFSGMDLNINELRSPGSQKMTLAPYESLPPEIRCAILEQIKWCKYRGWSTCAAVCKEWQPVIEEENFCRLKLGGECLAAFARIVRAREYVRHIWFDIQLPSYLCPSCEEMEPRQRLANINSRYSFAVYKLFHVLKHWGGSHDLTLELNAYCAGD